MKSCACRLSGRRVSSISRFLCGSQLSWLLPSSLPVGFLPYAMIYLPRVVNPLIVSAIFSLVASTAYGEAWKAVAKSSPANLAKFYLAALVVEADGRYAGVPHLRAGMRQAEHPGIHRHLRPFLCRASRVRLHLLRSGREKEPSFISGSETNN